MVVVYVCVGGVVVVVVKSKPLLCMGVGGMDILWNIS